MDKYIKDFIDCPEKALIDRDNNDIINSVIGAKEKGIPKERAVFLMKEYTLKKVFGAESSEQLKTTMETMIDIFNIIDEVYGED